MERKTIMKNISYIYSFEKRGAIVPEHILPNELWIDVGNSDREQVFDHHQINSYESSFECILKCWKRQMKSWEKLDKIPEEIKIHVHEYPDIDCIASVWMIQKMIGSGATHPTGLYPASVLDTLCEYVNAIDSGKKKFISGLTLYAYICSIDNDMVGVSKDDAECTLKTSEIILKEGLQVFDLLLERLGQGKKTDLFSEPLKSYVDVRQLHYYDKAESDLRGCYECYCQGKKENRVIIKAVNVWNHVEKCMKPVKAAIWRKQAKGKNEYLFAREQDQCILTVYPYDTGEEQDLIQRKTRVIIALNPNMEEASEYTLRPIAEILEQYEQIEENKLFVQTGYYRRDHSHARESQGRFSEVPFSETSDPWYLSEAEDLIDAPREESILRYETVLSIVENAASVALSAEIRVLQEQNQSVDTKEQKGFGKIKFGELYQIVRQKLSDLSECNLYGYLFVTVEVDPSMLSHGNEWLRTCCLNLAGKQESEMNRDNILYLDYRTCIYVDQTMLVIAYTKSDTGAIRHLLKNSVDQSDVYQDLKNLLKQQQELRAIGDGIARSAQEMKENRDVYDSFNTRLIHLSAQMQRDDLIIDPVEQEVYCFLKRNMGINELKENVLTTAELLIQNARQKREREEKEERQEQEKREKRAEDAERRRDNQIQAIMGLFALLGIFSALADCFDFVAKFLTGGEFWKFSHGDMAIELGIIAVIGVVSIIAIYFAIRAIQCAWKDKNKKDGI